jgi:hypothetical protein
LEEIVGKKNPQPDSLQVESDLRLTVGKFCGHLCRKQKGRLAGGLMNV